MVDIYHSEFLTNLIHQATDRKNRYKPVKHVKLGVGDIVLLEEKFTKRYHYPLGRVLKVDTNSLGEVTAAKIRKGTTREIVYRHSTSLILLISNENTSEESKNTKISENIDKTLNSRKSKRKAAAIPNAKTKEILNNQKL